MTSGFATPEATRRYAEARAPAAPYGYAPLGITGLHVGRAGFGCYRVDEGVPQHREALEAALRGGCNLIDTSTNYADGGSERLVGGVLARAGRDGLPPRDAVVVVSKIGYVQGTNLDIVLERARRGRPFPEMVEYMDGCWHCIHPEFLEDQLARSLERLGLGTLDVGLLHNPEYFLSDAAHRGRRDLKSVRAEFYHRLAAAFRFFEDAVRRGLVRAYGVSSNTLGAAPDDPEATSVSRILETASEAGGPNHHCAVLQMPLNLIESGPALVANTGPDDGMTALEAARGARLGVLINRPLNAIVGRRLVRLADFEADAAHPIAALIDPKLPPERRAEPLSRQAIWLVASTPGVHCVLVGMRRVEYVGDVLPVLGWPPHPDPLAVYGQVTAGLRLR